MRLTNIEARELLSFDTLQLTGLPQTLVVVGPNGGGKTNLLRLPHDSVSMMPSRTLEIPAGGAPSRRDVAKRISAAYAACEKVAARSIAAETIWRPTWPHQVAAAGWPA